MAKRGRPRGFDRADALERAMDAFCRHGFEGSTLEGLLAAMGGISPPSFYHAFGSKEALFKEAVDLYVATIGGPTIQALEGAKTAREGIDAMLRLTVEALCRPGKPHGCLLVLGATNCAPANKGAEAYLLARRQRAPEVIRHRLERAVAEGDLQPHLDVGAVAAFYVTLLHGLAIRAGDGAPRTALMAAVDGAMAAWKPLTVGPAPRRRQSRFGSRRSAKR